MEDTRNAVLIKISTDEGLVGWGETVALGGVRRLIEEQFVPLVDRAESRPRPSKTVAATLGTLFP